MAESSNFVQPAMLMENLLRLKEYWGLIENGEVTAPANATAKQRRLADESMLRDLKDAMRRKYQGSPKVKRAQLQSLRCEFEILAMGEGETVN
ncbi:retrovirus-related pol polyprotein from transposon TNT 1-94, partial [Trifolium medium]|nr:retrovirus-related pol polyprotein from transposon TNT 1-94 [Trifolium medium]